MRNTLKFLISAILFLNNSIFSQDASNLPTGVVTYQLGNGTKVLLIRKPNIPMIGINAVVKVGSAYETFSTSGMSHMLEHLLFNGTAKMKQKELYDAVDFIGGYNNANTSEYYTNFMMVTPFENIEKGMEIQSAMLFDSILPEKKFEKEKRIVLEEIAKSLSNPQSQIERNTNAVLFSKHALSLPTLGTYETIKSMSRDDVYKFYKNYYVPNNMIISVVGNFKIQKMHELLTKYYGRQKPGNVLYPVLQHWSTGFEKYISENNIQNLYHKFYKGNNLQYQVFYKLPNKVLMEYYDLLEESLGRKSETIKKSFDMQFPEAIKNLRFSAKTSPVGNFLEVKFVLNQPVDYTKLEDNLTKQLSGLNYTIEKGKIESETIKSVTNFYKNTEKPHMFGIFNADNFAKHGIESVLSSYTGENYSIANNDLKTLKISNVYTSIVEHPFSDQDYNIKINGSSTKLFKGSPGKPTIIAKQAFQSNLLAVHYLLKYKSAYESKFGKDAAKYWNDAFGQRMKSSKVEKEAIKYGFTFTVNDNPYIPMDNIYLDPAFGYIRVEGLATDVKGAIKFLNNQMLNFIPTEEEFNNAKKNFSYSAMMAHGNRAKKLFNYELNKIIYAPPKYKAGKEKLTYNKLLEFGKYYFNPQNMIISVVSPNDPDSINAFLSNYTRPDVTELFSGMGYRQEFRSMSSPVSIDTAGGGEQAYIYFGYQKTIDKNETPILKALSLLLKDKIVFDIREKEGMAYRISAGIKVIDSTANFFINMSTRPENVNKLLPQFSKYFTPKFISEVDKKEITRVVNMYLGRMMFRRLSSINQAYYLGHSYYFYEDINYDSKLLAHLKSVNINDIINIGDKYLKIKNPIKIIVR